MDILRGCAEILINEIPFDEVMLDFSEHDRVAFAKYARCVFPEYSGNEIANIFDAVCLSGSKNIFQLIRKLSEALLEAAENGECEKYAVLCKAEEALRWRELSLKLGQDLFVAAFVADKKEGSLERLNYKPIIDMKSNVVAHGNVEKEIEKFSENHFHLYGSTQIFPLSFCSLMNHISGRGRDFKKLKCLLQYNKNFSVDAKNEKSMYNLALIAAGIRLYLFGKLKGEKSCDLSGKDFFRLSENDIWDVEKKIVSFRSLRAAQLFSKKEERPFGGEKEERLFLDYAMEKGEGKEPLRGEMRFLVSCFKECLKAKNEDVKAEDEVFNDADKKYFYAYLVQQFI